MTASVEIPDSLVTEIRDRVEESDFESTEEYVLFVLREVVRPHQELEYNETRAKGNREDQVYDRLEALGYVE